MEQSSHKHKKSMHDQKKKEKQIQKSQAVTDNLKRVEKTKKELQRCGKEKLAM